MSHYHAKFKENPCVGTDARTPLQKMTISNSVSALRLEISCKSSVGVNKSISHNVSYAAVRFSAL